MVPLKDLKEKIALFQSKFRNSNLPHFKISGLYDLCPQLPRTNLEKIEGAWPDQWPNSDQPGVYLILNEKLELLYVGKASMRNVMGVRLSSYFNGSAKGPCKICPGWQGEPRYLFTIGMPKETSFEAAALEEYLIRELSPPENVRGK
ncbi:MAG: GIY-YIG nuclease family protein [Nitrospirales bacterium]